MISAPETNGSCMCVGVPTAETKIAVFDKVRNKRNFGCLSAREWRSETRLRNADSRSAAVQKTGHGRNVKGAWTTRWKTRFRVSV